MEAAVAHGPLVAAEQDQHARLVRLQREVPEQHQDRENDHEQRREDPNRHDPSGPGRDDPELIGLPERQKDHDDHGDDG